MEYRISTNLKYRIFERDDDQDIFISTKNCVVECYISEESRIQFIKIKAILVKLSSISNLMTVHFLEENDLYSSVANLEISANLLSIMLDDENKVIVKG
ncbi:MAG: hypothetical protein ATN36_02025 [Epulopiscium sp. Nele67-Bin005]|nr:MAG: hypothetical protein ATN36_02025 [Epulopiscium sp. Nele67-Bin005]